MSVTIQDNFNTAAAKPIDDRYGPYNSDAAAALAIPETFRYKGLTVGVLNSGVVEEYWWDNVLTGNPIKKSSSGNITSISQGTGILVSTTTPNSVQAPGVSIDSTVVQIKSNLSTSVSTDGTSDTKYPSVKAVKDYADGLVVGLLNDRGNWAAGASPGPYPSNPPATGSGPAGAILKGDIWFISTNGFLGTTAVSIGASVRALVDSPNPSTDADWDIIDAGLGFTPEDTANKVTTGAGITGDPNSPTKYPSLKALTEYLATQTPTTPSLQAVTNVGASTTNTISAASFKFNEVSTTNYAELLCTSTGVITVNDSLGNKRLSLNKAGTDLTVWTNSGTVNSILDFASVASTQTFTFPNATGTIALLSDLSVYLTTSAATTTYVPYTGATGNVDLGTYALNFTGSLADTLSIDSDEIRFQQSSSYDTIINGLGINFLYNTASLSLNSNAGNSPYVTAISSTGNIVEIKAAGLGANTSGYALFGYGPTGCYTTLRANLSATPGTVSTLSLPLTSGTLVATVATDGGSLSTGSDGKVTIPDAGSSTRGLINTSLQTFSGTKIFNNQLEVNNNIIATNNIQGANYFGSVVTGTNVNAPNLFIYSGRGTGNGAGGDIYINTYNTGSSGPSIQTSTTKVIIKGTTGNVGIGTTSPSANFQVAQSTSGVGTVTISGGSLSVTGVGTQFTNTFKVGDSITIGLETRTITAVNSDTSLTVNFQWTQTIVNGAYTLTGGTRFTVRGNGQVIVGNGGGTMTLFPYETFILNNSGDVKFGVYTSASNPILAGNGAAAIVVGATNFTLFDGSYPGFEYQFVGSGTEKDNRIRFNFIKRNNSGIVTTSKQDILNIFADGRVLIGGSEANPSANPPTADSSALLEVKQSSVTGAPIGGFLPPRVTAAQRATISSPADGLMVYQTDGTKGIYVYDSSGPAWRILNWT